MNNLREKPARPRTSRLAPAYPRGIALGAIFLAGCGAVVNNGTTGPIEESPSGAIALPYDTGNADADAGSDARDAKETAVLPAPPDTEPSPAGGQPYPFDGDLPGEDACPLDADPPKQ